MLIEYSGAIINPEKILYCVCSRYDSGGIWKWKFTVKFEGGQELKWNGYKTQEEARDKQDEFFREMQKHSYVINELMS